MRHIRTIARNGHQVVIHVVASEFRARLDGRPETDAFESFTPYARRERAAALLAITGTAHAMLDGV